MLQLRLGVMFQQMPFLNVFNHVPADVQMLGDVLDRHQPGQFQHIAFEGACEGTAGIGKRDFDLPDGTAIAASDAGQG